jgi:hypothetical protein
MQIAIVRLRKVMARILAKTPVAVTQFSIAVNIAMTCQAKTAHDKIIYSLTGIAIIADNQKD